MNTKTSFVKLICATMTLTAAALALAHEGHDDHQGASIGEAGDAAKVTHTLTVTLTDAMHFTPDHFSVKRGDTIRFVIKNAGKLPHEFMLGTSEVLQQHAEMMRKNPDMKHVEPNVANVDPGRSGEVIWHFSQAGTVGFACLQPGHYEAGMKGAIKVMGN